MKFFLYSILGRFSKILSSKWSVDKLFKSWRVEEIFVFAPSHNDVLSYKQTEIEKLWKKKSNKKKKSKNSYILFQLIFSQHCCWEEVIQLAF